MSTAVAKKFVQPSGFRPLKAWNGELFTEMRTVTPEMAADALTRNRSNRRMRRAFIERLAKDMIDGRFKTTHQGIGFNTSGDLVDGQHRLSAIIKAGVSINLLVTWGIGDEDCTSLDGGQLRSVPDIGHFRGLQISIAEAGAARRMFIGGRGNVSNPSRVELLDFIQVHEEAIKFAANGLSGAPNGIKTASAMAVFARAFYHVDRGVLERGMFILKNGTSPDDISLPEDKTLNKLRDVLMTTSKQGGGNTVALKNYHLTTRAVRAFVAGEQLSILRITSAAQEYELPESELVLA